MYKTSYVSPRQGVASRLCAVLELGNSGFWGGPISGVDKERKPQRTQRHTEAPEEGLSGFRCSRLPIISRGLFSEFQLVRASAADPRAGRPRDSRQGAGATVGRWTDEGVRPYVVCAGASWACSSSSRSRRVCKIPSALLGLTENFSVPSGVNCVPRCDATKRASLPGSIDAFWLNLMFMNSRLRSMAVAPTRIACSLRAA